MGRLITPRRLLLLAVLVALGASFFYAMNDELSAKWRAKRASQSDAGRGIAFACRSHGRRRILSVSRQVRKRRESSRAQHGRYCPSPTSKRALPPWCYWN